jgi:hypothetical protein
LASSLIGGCNARRGENAFAMSHATVAASERAHSNRNEHAAKKNESMHSNRNGRNINAMNQKLADLSVGSSLSNFLIISIATLLKSSWLPLPIFSRPLNAFT